MGFWSAVLFGIVFSIGWTPCVGAFLGSALMLASQQGSVFKGILMLSAYSLGLGIPFVISALLLDRLKGAFDAVRRHQRLVNLVSGGMLVVLGILMMTGLIGRLLSALSF
jgi:cytochrome c-type biogenesis protein